jgi:hypothetical protein
LAAAGARRHSEKLLGRNENITARMRDLRPAPMKSRERYSVILSPSEKELFRGNSAMMPDLLGK